MYIHIHAYVLYQAERVATQYAPPAEGYAGRCGPAAAIPYACGAQRALLPIAIHINELMNINDIRESATIFPRPAS